MTGFTTKLGLRLCALMLIGMGAGCASQTETRNNLTTGKATQAWLGEQRNDTNRAEPEPYPAERAGQALKRYQGSLEGSGAPATTTGSTGSTARSGSPGSSTPGMGR